MQITLIRPPTVICRTELRADPSPPIGLAYLAGTLTAAGHQITAVDAVGSAIRNYFRIPGIPEVIGIGLLPAEIVLRIPPAAQLIGISCMFSTEWPLAKEVIHECRKKFPHAVIVAGGEHVTACPEYSMSDCLELDYCVLGEGEEILMNLIAAIESVQGPEKVAGIAYRREGQILITPRQERIREIDQIPQPEWRYFPLEEYIRSGAMPGVNIGRTMPMLASRGCPYECTFCSNPVMWGRLWRARDPELLLNEMKRWSREYGVTNFDFYDLTAIVRKDWLVRMSQLIIASGLAITWQLPLGTRSEALDKEAVEWLFRSGCRNLNYAPESGSERVITAIKKKFNKKAMKSSIHAAVSAGLKSKANFILGFPGETWKDVVRSYQYALQLAWAGLQDVSFFVFSPYPGSAIFNDLDRRGKVQWSDRYFYGLITNQKSSSEHLPDWSLPVWTQCGMLLFYSFSFLVRPWRFLALAVAVSSSRPKTRLDSALIRLRDRLKVYLKGFESHVETNVLQ